MTRVFVAILFVLVVVYLIQKRKAKPEAAETSREDTQRQLAQKSTPFHAVCIEPGPHSCAAAEELRGQRFLSADAPLLPLKNCTSSNCECRFVHFSDRRGRKDRRSELPRGVGTGATGEFEVDRRDLKDRRSDGLDDDL